jgi:hypothetical protein
MGVVARVVPMEQGTRVVCVFNQLGHASLRLARVSSRVPSPAPSLILAASWRIFSQGRRFILEKKIFISAICSRFVKKILIALISAFPVLFSSSVSHLIQSEGFCNDIFLRWKKSRLVAGREGWL